MMTNSFNASQRWDSNAQFCHQSINIPIQLSAEAQHMIARASSTCVPYKLMLRHKWAAKVSVPLDFMCNPLAGNSIVVEKPIARLQVRHLVLED